MRSFRGTCVLAILFSLPLHARMTKALVLFDEGSRHIDRVASMRSRIEQTGGRVRAVIGLAAIVADVDARATRELAAGEGVAGVFSGRIEAQRWKDAQTLAAVAAWNRLLSGPVKQPPGPPRGAPVTDVSIAPDLPRDEAERKEIEAMYRRHWESARRALPAELQRSESIGCGTNGAGYFDTSLYLAGSVAVGVFYVNGSSGGWSQNGSPGTASTTQVFADVVNALDYFVDAQPNGRLSFTYINEVDSAGLPLPTPTNERQYANDQRNIHCTDWGFLVSVRNGGVWPNAFLHGPSLRMDVTFGWFDHVTRHEVGHIFGAGDAYSPHAPSSRWGYLMAAHANACGTGGGYFAGAGECLDDLMAGWGANLGYNSVIGTWTAGQLGWHASRGDGVLDVMRTHPLIDPASIASVINPVTSAVSFTGVAYERPLLNELTSSWYTNVSINRIADAQYRIGNSDWQEATAADAIYDSTAETFQFTTPPLPNGTYDVHFRARNSVGTVTPVPHVQQITIAGSSVTNTRPFGSLTVTPQRAMVGTTITASAGASRDLENGPLTYSFKWDASSPWTPFTAVSTATHVYTAPGTYAVQMRVRDSGMLIHLVARTVVIEPYDTAPVVAFRARPEYRHWNPSGTYSLLLTLAGTRDAETPYQQLQAQWDIDCNGSWDYPPSTQKVRSVQLTNPFHPRSDRRCVRVQVLDGTNATEAERFVWVVPYDHRPSISGVTFVPNGPNVTVTVSATDPDPSWDGILEYRFDFEGDGIWETKFSPNASIVMPAAFQSTLVVEVIDRFHARATWMACAPFAC